MSTQDSEKLDEHRIILSGLFSMRVGIDSEYEILRLTLRPKLYITVYKA